ncbi:hypothetical protein BDV96DRAFT_616213 [Lophiotrema nucula]|uniref:Nucleic acid-binding protein n=1 Tax=Lophiotrema nucula TaxID=690887 RepID=A0A6A5YNZ1_9PLEO|nr:hypothetical protein BDV96DRAFT_616213 [Lophiotrema nucula]
MEQLAQAAARAATKKAIKPRTLVHQGPTSSKVGVVVSAGKMDRAVKVRIPGQEWHKKFRKFFPSSITHIVSDPNNSLQEGDVVRITSGHRVSKSIRHVVTAIVAPFGPPVEDRPPVLNTQQLLDLRIKQRLEKDVRAAARGRLASKERIKTARREGVKVPQLTDAFRNLEVKEVERRGVSERVVETIRKYKAMNEGRGTEGKGAEAKEAHAGQAGQMATAQARRTEAGVDTKEEVESKEKLKEESVQSLSEEEAMEKGKI